METKKNKKSKKYKEQKKQNKNEEQKKEIIENENSDDNSVNIDLSTSDNNWSKFQLNNKLSSKDINIHKFKSRLNNPSSNRRRKNIMLCNTSIKLHF